MTISLAASALVLTADVTAQRPAARPRAELVPAPPLRLTGEVDSNSPAIWDRVGGRPQLFVMTSINGQPSVAGGRTLTLLGPARAVALDPWPGGGVWMEAVIKDVDGTWYGYYHNEVVARMCGGDRVIPRIGAARSRDRGATWEGLGIVLDAPPRTHECSTTNTFLVGGVGDFSVQLDRASQDLYFFYSLYLRSSRAQGVAVARLAWADRDAPAGRMMVWRNGVWTPAWQVRNRQRWIYPAATPMLPAIESWHDEDTVVDAFWGPSVHWNTHLQRYVMLLNRAKDSDFQQEGVYVSYSARLDDPAGWSVPAQLVRGGRWYPQVLGLEEGTGTDKTAGEYARFFMMGTSQHFIRFTR